MRAKYAQGQGLLMQFEDKRMELELALDILYAIADRYNTENLNELILLVSNLVTEPPAVYKLCELCWTPIDPRIDKETTLDGRFYHAKCINKTAH